MSVEEAEQLLNLGREAAYAAARSGQLPVIRTAGRIQVLRKAMFRLIEEGNIRPQVNLDLDTDALARKLRILELESRVERDGAELQRLKTIELKQQHGLFHEQGGARL